MYAIAVASQQNVAKLLTDDGINLNLRDDAGRTAVFYAAQDGDLIITKLLADSPGVYNIFEI
jgi:ankyrin repeat protein